MKNLQKKLSECSLRGKIRSSVVKKVKNLALLIDFFHILLGEYILTLCRMGIFGSAYGWRGTKRALNS